MVYGKQDKAGKEQNWVFFFFSKKWVRGRCIMDGRLPYGVLFFFTFCLCWIWLNCLTTIRKDKKEGKRRTGG